MHQDRTRLERLLVNYYGFLQTAHLLGLVISGLFWIRRGDLGVLALPPAGGWSPQAVHFLVGTGLIDLMIALGSVFFVMAYRRENQYADVMGAAVLTGSLYSAAVYAYGTIRSGAWAAHPLAYGLVTLIFAPIVPLAFLFIWRRVNRNIQP